MLDPKFVLSDLTIYGRPAAHYDDGNASRPPERLMEVSVCADPDQLERIGQFFIECAKDLREGGAEKFGHAHFRDTVHKPDIVVCPPEDFAALFNMRVDGRDDAALARLCKVSIATIQRWKDGTTAPHPLLRPSVFDALDGRN